VRTVYMPIGLVLSCLLALAAPRFTSSRLAACNLAIMTPPVTAAAQQFAQDDSNGSNTMQQPYQPGEDNNNPGNDNSDQQNAQPGDENGDDSAQANPSDNDNGGEPPQVNANPDDSGNAEQNNQDSNDSQNSENPGNSQ